MHAGQEVLAGRDPAPIQEWFLGNGIGGFACGARTCLAARPLHSHLTVATPHGRRTTLLVGFGERLIDTDGTFDLAPRSPATGRLGNGHAQLESFRLDPWPVWRYRAGATTLEKSLHLIDAHHAVVTAWRHVAGDPARVIVSPLVVARPPEGRESREREMRGAAQGIPGRVRVETRAGSPALTLWHNGAFLPARVWQFLPHPSEDADAAGEDAFVPGYIEGAVAPGQPLYVIASVEEDLFRALAREDRLGTPPPRSLAACAEAIAAGERARRAHWRRTALESADRTARQARTAHRGAGAAPEAETPLLDRRAPWIETCAGALELGLVRRGTRLTALGAVPGGLERTADVMRVTAALVSLRAFDVAREVLRGAIEYLDEGIAAAGFDVEDGRPRYGDPEASLWLISAAELYTRRSGDLEFARDVLYPALEPVSQYYRSGTRHGIRVDADGLLAAGKGDQATKRADVNALWYQAQVALAQLARLLGRRENSAFFLAWAHEHQRTFVESFWDEPAGRLRVAIGAAGARGGIEPSQILAASLKPAVLPHEQAARLVETFEAELFTPFGLRATPVARVAECAWLAPFASAYLRAHRRDADSQARVRAWLDGLAAGCGGATGHDAAGSHPLCVPERFTVDGATIAPSDTGEPISVLAAAELAQLWIEELDHEPSEVGESDLVSS